MWQQRVAERVIGHNFTRFYKRKKKVEVTLIGQKLIVLSFNENVRRSHYFCGHNVLTESVFVTQVSGDAGITV
jgi:hypothetical protein